MSKGSGKRSRGRFAATAARLAAKAVFVFYAAWFVVEMCRYVVLVST